MLKDGLLHRAWRLLPRPARQALYARATALGVGHARAGDGARIVAPVTVVGALRAPTGLGQAARLAVSALAERGVPVRAIDLTEALFQPVTEPAPDVPGGAPGEGTLLVYATPPNAARALALVGREVRATKTRVAGWVCETEALPPLWSEQARFFDVLTAPSRFAADAISRATRRPVRVIGHPVAVEGVSGARTRPDRPYTIGAMFDVGSSAARKDVAGLVAILRGVLAANGDARALIKARDIGADATARSLLSSLEAGAPGRVVVVTADEDRAAARAFLERIDLLVSASRAEGFGLPHAEAVLAGVPVAAPIWGGPADFLDATNALALPYSLVDIVDPAGLYTPAMGRWAAVDVAAAIEIVGARIARGPRSTAPVAVPPILTTGFFVDALMAEART